jgi:hypothetical protein
VAVVGDALAAADENLRQEGFGGAGNIAQHLVVDRDIAPAEELLAFGADDVGIHLFAFLALDGIARQEDQSGSEFIGAGRQLDAQFAALFAEKFFRQLHHDAGAVAGHLVAAAGAAVGQVDEDIQRLVDDIVGFLALEVHHATHAAGVVFKTRIVQPLRLRQPAVGHLCTIIRHSRFP